jgi:uncharacterized protein (DUF302 family)
MKTIKLTILMMIVGMLSVNAQMTKGSDETESELYFSKKVKGSMEEVNQKVTDALKAEKFGVITEVDMSGTLKKKLDVDIQPYKILGVCNPQAAYDALQAEPNVGVFLPCKVILKQLDENTVEVVSINPKHMMEMLGNEKLNKTADVIGDKLEKIILGL